MSAVPRGGTGADQQGGPHRPAGRTAPDGGSRGAGPSALPGGTGARFMPDVLTELFQNPLDAGYYDAARRRAGRPEQPPLHRQAARWTRLAVLALTGFLLAVAYQHVIDAKPETSQARAKLISDIQARRAENDALQRRADTLRSQVAAARDAAIGGGEADRLRLLENEAGLVKVRGDGAEVRLTDAPAPIDPVTGKASPTNLGRVLDRDLQDVTNELWRDGAEAIAINGERLSATSTIRQAGGAILVDFQPVSGPYRVTAIGPGNLARRFSDSGTGRRFGRYVGLYHMGYSVRAVTGVTLPAASEPNLTVARPVSSGAAPDGSGAPSAPAGGSSAPAGAGAAPPGGTAGPEPTTSSGGG